MHRYQTPSTERKVRAALDQVLRPELNAGCIHGKCLDLTCGPGRLTDCLAEWLTGWPEPDWAGWEMNVIVM